jgi:hypothetical protein
MTVLVELGKLTYYTRSRRAGFDAFDPRNDQAESLANASDL